MAFVKSRPSLLNEAPEVPSGCAAPAHQAVSPGGALAAERLAPDIHLAHMGCMMRSAVPRRKGRLRARPRCRPGASPTAGRYTQGLVIGGAAVAGCTLLHRSAVVAVSW